jgi:hypothetical protein
MSLSRLRRLLPALVVLAVVAELPSQEAPAGERAALAALVRRTLDGFANASPERFDSLYPFPDGRQLVRWAAEANWPRVAARGGVVSIDGDRAVLYLSGHPVTGSSGYETSLGRMFTGLYEAERDSSGWRLTRRLAPAMGNRIRSHAAGVILQPGERLEVSDTMAVVVGEGGALWLSLNRSAELRVVEVNGRPARHRQMGGLLWIEADAGAARVHLGYTLDATRDSAPNANFGRLEPDFGHVRDQHYWLPFFGFDAPEGIAEFRLSVSVPAEFAVVTGLRQRDTIVEGRRVVAARSDRPTAAVTLMYDRAWSPTRRPLGGGTAELFLADPVEPSRQAIDSALGAVHAVLARRFGDPRAGYVALVQGRGLPGWGWLFRSNDMVVAGHRGGPLERTGAVPRALFGHEVAHGWTSASGPGRNLLSEGWAMFAEGLMIEASHGADAGRRFWEWMRAAYLTEGHEGGNTLLGDDFNGGVSYTKGGWVLRMLEDAMGRDAFDRGMRAYMASPLDQERSIDAFTAAMTLAAGWDVAAYLRPWLEESRIPSLTARIEGRRIIVRQDGPVFRLPIDIQIHDEDGEHAARRVWIGQREDTIAIERAVARPARVRLDPDHRLLMHRAEGDMVRFWLDAPEAKRVLLRGSFTSAPIEAAPGVGGRWHVELPISEGRYSVFWVVDGSRREAANGGILEVEPVRSLDPAPAYPR